MTLKKLGKTLLFPRVAVLALLTPIAVVLLVCASVLWDSDSALAILSYLTAAYTLTVWCMRIPYLIKRIGDFKRKNKYVRRWLSDDRLRVNTSLLVALLWNAAYGVFQSVLGIYHGSFWFGALALYYLALAAMRLSLWRATGRGRAEPDRVSAYRQYRRCGWVLLSTSLALALIVFFMIYWGRTFYHHMITTIAMAAYTFTSLTFAIISAIRYRKYQSPVFSASKVIGLAAASVSMLTLTSTMLTTFGNADDGLRKPMLALTGGAVSAVIILLAVYMIVQGTKQLKLIRKEEKIGGTE